MFSYLLAVDTNKSHKNKQKIEVKAKGRLVGLENGSSKNKGSETLENKTKENFYFYNHQGDHHGTIITMREVLYKLRNSCNWNL